jgi:alpha-beta hydrolase superfamily lysophospholipase
MVVWVVVAAVAALVGGTFLGALYAADVFTRSRRQRVQGTPESLGLRFDEVQFRAPDMTVLRGWFMESPGARATILMVHDTDGTRADPEVGMLRLQRAYVRNGFNVFAFDLRGRGESSGSRDHLGAEEQLDLKTAMGYVSRRTNDLPVVLHGFGLGASLALQATAEGIGARGVIADSAYPSARGQLRFQHRRIPGPIFSLGCWAARRLHGADVDALRPIVAMPHLQSIPTLLIHGELDRRVPVGQAHNLLAAALSERADLWVVPDAGHCRAYRVAPDEYLRRALRLVDAAVPARTLRLATAAAV